MKNKIEKISISTPFFRRLENDPEKVEAIFTYDLEDFQISNSGEAVLDWDTGEVETLVEVHFRGESLVLEEHHPFYEKLTREFLEWKKSHLSELEG